MYRQYYSIVENEIRQRVMEGKNLNRNEIESLVIRTILDMEIKGYSKAMEFLVEEDTCLTKSISIAEAYEYRLDDIDSELLATLLLREYLFEEKEKLVEFGMNVLKEKTK